MEAEGYSRRGFVFPENGRIFCLKMCFMCFLGKVNLEQDFSPISPPCLHRLHRDNKDNRDSRVNMDN